MSYAPIESTGLNRIAISQGTLLSNSTSFSVRRSHQQVNGSSKRRSRRDDYPIIVHCHLCWDWVWQRPQQFLSRLSQRHRVLFVEMHAPEENLIVPTARLQKISACPNITLLQMQFPSWRWSDGDFVDEQRRELLTKALHGPLRGQFDEPVQWFYDPMAVTAFAGQMNEICTVYDCMDELSKFRGAPPSLIEREAELLKVADVVFAGGRKLCEAKSKSNGNCHFYGCGVDVEHFGKALLDETEIPADARDLSKPVLGFFGVVDERMDYELIAKLADANPNWSVVIIGPAAKVDPAMLPRRVNLRWLGGRDYAQLPAYCKALDLCVMPFALNEATEFINPTKALEYMATGRNIVSSAVPDVVRNFGQVVKIANSHEEFIAHCQQLIARPDRKAIESGLELARANSWESIVEKLEGHIVEAIASTAKPVPV
jgi:glycosyltransferase involved in cell wall biosynthesis